MMTCLHNGTCATRLFSAFVLFTRLGQGISSYVLESTISHIPCFLNRKKKKNVRQLLTYQLVASDSRSSSWGHSIQLYAYMDYRCSRIVPLTCTPQRGYVQNKLVFHTKTEPEDVSSTILELLQKD